MSNSKMKLKLYQCVYCGLQYKDVVSIYLHLNSIHKHKKKDDGNTDQKSTEVLQNKFACAICKFKSDDFPTMHSHLLLTHTNNKKDITQNLVPKRTLLSPDISEKNVLYKCIKCAKYFWSKMCCLEHIESIHNYKIPEPKAEFNLSPYTQEKNITVYRCLHCFTFFNCPIECRKHIQINHINKTSVEITNEPSFNNLMNKKLIYKCSVCLCYYSTRDQCTNHLLLVHFLNLTHANKSTNYRICQCARPLLESQKPMTGIYSCIACSTCYVNKVDCLTHIRLLHSHLKKDQFFNEKNNLICNTKQENLYKSKAMIGRVKTVQYNQEFTINIKKEYEENITTEK